MVGLPPGTDHQPTIYRLTTSLKPVRIRLKAVVRAISSQAPRVGRERWRRVVTAVTQRQPVQGQGLPTKHPRMRSQRDRWADLPGQPVRRQANVLLGPMPPPGSSTMPELRSAPTSRPVSAQQGYCRLCRPGTPAIREVGSRQRSPRLPTPPPVQAGRASRRRSSRVSDWIYPNQFTDSRPGLAKDHHTFDDPIHTRYQRHR
jgi:hypothetical protein